MTNTAPDLIDIDVAAEDAPIGVQLWPTIDPKYAPNFTLEAVQIIRERDRTSVHWIYESGRTRIFRKGERVACRVAR